METKSLSQVISSRVLAKGDLESFSPREDVVVDFNMMVQFMEPTDIVVIEDEDNILAIVGATDCDWGCEVFVIPSVYLREDHHFGFFRICKKMVQATVDVRGEAYAHCYKNSHEKWLRLLGFTMEAEMAVGELEYYRFKKVK